VDNPIPTRAKVGGEAGWRRLVSPRQFLAYLGVGVVGTGGHYLALVALVRGAGLDPVVATTCGFAVGAVINYVANYHLTFRSRRSHAGTMPRFFAIALAGMGVNAGVMAACHRGLGLHYLLSQVLATGTVVVLTYLGNRLWTFREVNDA
jgi:putative flippase GtrA